MKTLTQVWLFCVVSSFLTLVVGFQIGGRLGLFFAFLLCLFFLYLVLYKGLQIFKQKTAATEISGSDPSHFLTLLNETAPHYNYQKVRLFVAHNPTPPLIWPEFSKQLTVFVHYKTLEQLNLNEKKCLAHMLLSHGMQHSKLSRKILAHLYLSLSPLRFVLAPLFNLIAKTLGLTREIYRADLAALAKSQASAFDFGLLLHKLHLVKYHKNDVPEGTYFFSILSKIEPRLYNLNFHPNLNLREKNILGYSVS